MRGHSQLTFELPKQPIRPAHGAFQSDAALLQLVSTAYGADAGLKLFWAGPGSTPLHTALNVSQS
jgi:hypothetical protein